MLHRGRTSGVTEFTCLRCALPLIHVLCLPYDNEHLTKELVNMHCRLQVHSLQMFMHHGTGTNFHEDILIVSFDCYRL
jgi:hypothetical protein